MEQLQPKDGFQGGCACGAVHYTVAMPIKRMTNCHCYMCREMNGSAFSSYAIVREEKFSVQGEPAVFQVTENVQKHFCASCGTPLFNSNKLYPAARMVYLGSLQDHSLLQPTLNLYCESMLEWVMQLDKYPMYQRGLKD